DRGERDAPRARLGGPRDPRAVEHDPAARQGLRQRGHRPAAVLPGGATRRDLPRPQGQVPGPARCHAAEAVGGPPRARRRADPPKRPTWALRTLPRARGSGPAATTGYRFSAAASGSSSSSWTSGRTRVNTVRPGRLSTVRVPSWWCATWRAIARPRPLPPPAPL